MEPTIANSTLPVARPLWDNARLSSRIVHLGCGAFHRAHQALYTHHLLEQSDSDWGICEVNLMPGNDQTLIENLKKQNLLRRCIRQLTAVPVYWRPWPASRPPLSH